MTHNKSDSGNGAFELLTIKEVAVWLKVSPMTIRRLQSDRRIPFIKVGGCVRFDKSDIVRYLQENRIEPIR